MAAAAETRKCHALAMHHDVARSLSLSLSLSLLQSSAIKIVAHSFALACFGA